MEYKATRMCIVCNQEKPLSEFYERIKLKGKGLSSRMTKCKQCDKEDSGNRQRMKRYLKTPTDALVKELNALKKQIDAIQKVIDERRKTDDGTLES